MSTQLDELLSTQRQLLRDISHELRSPLNRIRVALDLARKKSTNSTENEFNRIEKEIEQLDFLIRELLTFVRIQPKKPQ